jgi:putative membrane protein
MLTRFLIHVLALIVVFLAIWHVPSNTIGVAIVMALALALINAIIRPILLILTLPVTILTLGLFIIVLNALLFGLSFIVAENLLGFHFHLSFLSVLFGYIVYVVISTVLTHIF